MPGRHIPACHAPNSPICFSTMPACLGDTTAETTISATLFVCRLTSQSQRPMVRYTHRTHTDRFRNFFALIGNPRSSQQLMGQLPICCCSKAKKFNDCSRARVGVCVQRVRDRPATLFVCRLTSQSQRPMVRYTHRTHTDRFRNFFALIGNPRSSQQLMGQLPICCCSKAKKFNDCSRARVGVCVQRVRDRPSMSARAAS